MTRSSPPTFPADAQRYRAHGVLFRYPKGWHELALSRAAASSGDQRWNATVGLDDLNFVSVSGYAIDVRITGDAIDRHRAGIARQVSALFARAGGSMDGGPIDQTMAGLRALGFSGTAKSPGGRAVSSRLVLAFDGTTEYFVNCQYDASGERRILAGCDLIVGTFTLR